MSQLLKADPNMRAVFHAEGLEFVDPRATKAQIYGLIEGEYARFPAPLRALADENLRYLQGNTSGGRIRFVTNSKKLGIHLRIQPCELIYNFSYIGFAGIDAYLGDKHPLRALGVCCPPLGEREALVEFPLSGKEECITLYLPLYAGVELLEIGVEPGAVIEAPPSYTHTKPILYYGSSITQGGCASRAGNSYCALVSRWLDSDFTCLGFSGCAKGEPWLARWIAEQDMSCFVYDYDHNAPDAEYLRQTHQPFLKTILDRQPELPVILLSKPNPQPGTQDAERRDIIRETALWAESEGHRVRFLDGGTLFSGRNSEGCTVDSIHPNDLGFFRMAEALYPILREFLEP